MQKIIALLLFVTLLNCSPKLGSTIFKIVPALPNNTLVVVLELTDEQKIEADLIGEIQTTDNGFSEKCSYYESVQNLKVLTRNSGANLIKITKHKPVDKFSSCHRIWATIYKVDNPRKYEKEIEWSASRKLTWDDFKGPPDIEKYPDALAATNSGFGYANSINLFKANKIHVKTIFYTNTSFVLPKGRNDYVLRHEQIHFDITEIYSRKLRKAYANLNITSITSGKAKSIFLEVFEDFKNRQDAYDIETIRGEKKEIQEKWEAIIKIELAKYDLYKLN